MLPKLGDTAYLVGKIVEVNTSHRPFCRVKTDIGDFTDSFLTYIDQITLIEPADEEEQGVEA